MSASVIGKGGQNIPASLEENHLDFQISKRSFKIIIVFSIIESEIKHLTVSILA